MKKRRELDALIGNRAKKDTQEGAFEYDSLNSSLSSPTADTYMPPNYYSAAKRISRSTPNGCGCTLRKMIRICLPICFLSLVAACITACIGIVWMQVQLKTDVDKLKDQVAKLESWQAGQPSSLDDMKKTIAVIAKDMSEVREYGIKGLAERLALLKENFEEQVKVPSEKLDQLKLEYNALKTKLKDLESTVDELKSQSSAAKASQQVISASFAKLKDSVDTIRDQVSEDNHKQLELISASKQYLKQEITKFNVSLQLVSKNMTVFDQKLESMKRMNEKLVTTTQKGMVRNAVKSKVPSLVSTSVPSAESSGKPNVFKHSKGEVGSKSLDSAELPDLFADLKTNYEVIDANGDHVLSAKELKDQYGELIASRLAQFDSNKDGVISYPEIETLQPTLQTGGISSSTITVR